MKIFKILNLLALKHNKYKIHNFGKKLLYLLWINKNYRIVSMEKHNN